MKFPLEILSLFLLVAGTLTQDLDLVNGLGYGDVVKPTEKPKIDKKPDTDAALGQRVKVEPEVSSYPGQTVHLHCAFTDSTGISLTMVTWIYESKEGERTNIAVFHPRFPPHYPDSPVKGRVSFSVSPPQLNSPSIQIRDVRMNDEGRYICEYAIYPSGNEQGITQLVMLAKPQNSASIVTVEAGTSQVVVARCDSVNGRPAAQVKWVTTANGNATVESKISADNTVTISSEYRMVPKPEDNGKDISCVVTHRTLEKPDSFPLKLAVQYVPQVTIVGYDNNWYLGRPNVVLTCQAIANPIPLSVTWKTMTGELPDTVKITDNELKVLKVDEAVNTTFVCEVKNRIGIGKDQITAFVREDNGFNLEDALVPESKNPEPPKKGDNGFNLEDALNPGWQSNMIQKLGEVLKNQRQQIEMLSKLLARVYKK